MGSTDLDLLGRYASGRDAEAFAELVARHRDMVYAACYRVLASRADAEDSTHCASRWCCTSSKAGRSGLSARSLACRSRQSP
jgi:hypothetical protein